MKIELLEDDNGYRIRTALKITWDDGKSETFYDSGEPEDNRFCRDWSWIEGALQRAYEEGQCSITRLLPNGYDDL